jgi:exodeoxyribonuclease VII large subunit
VADLPFGARRRDPSLRSSATTEAADEGGAAPFIYSVSGLQRRLRAEVERGFGNVLVGGEVSSLTLHGTSGHAYFVLKDAQAQLRCVMWKEQLARLRFRLENGVEVVARGRATVFERSGTLQLTVQSLERHGDGAEEEAFRRLAEKLRQEGLTSPSRKRPLPLLPRAVGVVTSRSGAALRDVLKTALRRDPFTRLVIAPTAVQGAGAAEEIAEAIRRLDASGDCDVVIVARGGGSREDLWAFNDERVARAIVACRVPVVTGIGHETDTSIADLVADLSCSTPTAATEHVVPVRAELRHRFVVVENRLHRAMRANLRTATNQLLELEAHLTQLSPETLMRRRAQAFDELVTRAERSARMSLGRRQQRLAQLERRLMRLEPRAKVASLAARLQILEARARHALERGVERGRETLGILATRVDALSPLAVLGRGYAIVERPHAAPDARVVRHALEVEVGDALRVRLGDGHIDVSVTGREGPDPDERAAWAALQATPASARGRALRRPKDDQGRVARFDPTPPRRKKPPPGHGR